MASAQTNAAKPAAVASPISHLYSLSTFTARIRAWVFQVANPSGRQ
jgi:hypothetical protein